MENYVYTTVPGKITPLLNKIKDVGIPSKADRTWLKANGFTSSNDRSLLTILKAIGFMDNSNVPSDIWKNYRTADHAKVLASAVKNGYKDLFDHFDNANDRSNMDLENFFTANSNSGKQVVSKTVATFKALCEVADFTTSSAITSNDHVANTKVDSCTVPHTISVNRPSDSTSININIQLTIPASADPSVYDNLFAAMKKHLWEKNN